MFEDEKECFECFDCLFCYNIGALEIEQGLECVSVVLGTFLGLFRGSGRKSTCV